MPSAPGPAPSSFLSSLLAHNFNLSAAAATLPPDQFPALASNQQLLAQLSSLLTLSTTCLALRQSQVRQHVLTELSALLVRATDDIEKRRAATALLRATAPSLAPSSGRGARVFAGVEGGEGDEGGEGSSSAPPPRIPRAHTRPSPDLTPAQVITHIRQSLQSNDLPAPNTGLATLAAFCDHDADLDDEPLPTDDTRQTIETLADSDVSRCLNAVVRQSPEDIPAEPAPDEPQTTCGSLTFATGNARVSTRLTFTLSRSPNSRCPNCWLITSIHIDTYTFDSS